MNVLLTCAGRRQYLVQYFRKALAGSGAVYAADCNPLAPTMLAADGAFTLPPVSDPRYIDLLLDLCRQNRVGLILPLSDVELPTVAPCRQRFLEAGTILVVASPETVDICADKWRAHQYLSARRIPTPITYCSFEDAIEALRTGLLTYPVLVKPRWGAASQWIERCCDEEELELACRLVGLRAAKCPQPTRHAQGPSRCVVVQQWMNGDEYGLDVVNDLDGGYVCTFARRKLAMRAGETDRAVTIDDPRLSRLGKRLGEALAHAGNLDCDVFWGREGPCVVDMNPRFGGGYPFSHVAGADLPAALIAWANGLPPNPRWFIVEPGVMSAKCDHLVVRSPRRLTAASFEDVCPAEERD